MSRSYKKHFRCKQKNSKIEKKRANKKVRHFKSDLPNGKAYRKLFESWDICDWNWIWTKQDAINGYNRKSNSSWVNDHYETLEEYLIYWEKCVKRK